MYQNIDDKLRMLLMLDWLRPERAIMRLFKTIYLEKIDFRSPSLDLSCGDGSLMFLHFGGRFEDNFDHFLATSANQFSHDKFVDIYDVKPDLKPKIKFPPNRVIDFGTDWKEEVLSKARDLGVYGELIYHDNNQLPLPFGDSSLATVFSNAIYWIDEMENAMKDIHRILQPGGQIILQVMTPNFLGTLDRLDGILSDRAINILDRNRRATMPSPRSYSEWENITKKAGFHEVALESMFPNEFLIDIWNVGLRPISHLLIQMADELDLDRRRRIKKEWVDIFHTLFLQLVSTPPNCPIENSPYIQITARK